MRITSMKKPMVVTKDEWISSALTDDEMVVELLLRLKHAGTVESGNNPAANLSLLQWGFRQRRSRPSRLVVDVSVGGFLKKETENAKASPTTPLCWSGGTGSGGTGSGGSTCPSVATADKFENTSRQASCSTSTGSRSGSKTFLEHKDAEKLQLKERLNLEKKIANVQVTYHEQSTNNRNLKRIKLEYSDRVKTDLFSKPSLDASHKRRCLTCKDEQNVSGSYRITSEIKSSEEKGFFFLPDLNLTPTVEDDTLYGTS